MLAAFRAAGFKKTISHQEPHALLDWLASKLNENDLNYISDSMINAAASKPSTAQLSDEKDALLTHLFPDLNQSTMDVFPVSDQMIGQPHGPPGWLEEPSDDDELEQQLKELAEERASIRAQIQEIQLLDSQLSLNASPLTRGADLSHTLALERAAVSSLDAAVQERAAKLTSTLKEICEATKPQNTRLWLVLTDSAERESYLKEEVRMMEQVAKQLQLVEARGTRGLSEVKPAVNLSLSHEDEKEGFKKLTSSDPFSSSSSSSSSRDILDQALDANEIQTLLSEGARLRDCIKEVEAAYIEAKLDATQQAAELDTLRTLTSQQGNTQGSSLTKAERDWLIQLQEEVSRLQAEEDRIVSTELSQVLDDLGKLQDLRLLKCQYELQGRIQSALLSQRSILIKAMLSASSRRLLVDAVQEAEKAELNKLQGALTSLDLLFSGLINASDSRCARYKEAGLTLGQPSSLASKLAALLGELNRNGSQDQLQTLDSEVERLTLGSRTDLGSLQGFISRSRSLAQDARSILVHPPDDTDPLPPPQNGPLPVILHPPSLDSKLNQVRTAAYELNELINQAKQEHDRFHALITENKEEMMAERSVLEWFHLEPEKLSSHIAQMDMS